MLFGGYRQDKRLLSFWPCGERPTGSALLDVLMPRVIVGANRFLQLVL